METIKNRKTYKVNTAHSLVIEQYFNSVYQRFYWRYRIVNDEHPNYYPAYWGEMLKSRPSAKRIINSFTN